MKIFKSGVDFLKWSDHGSFWAAGQEVVVLIAGTKIEVLFSCSRICGKQLRCWVAHCEQSEEKSECCTYNCIQLNSTREKLNYL